MVNPTCDKDPHSQGGSTQHSNTNQFFHTGGAAMPGAGQSSSGQKQQHATWQQPYYPPQVQYIPIATGNNTNQSTDHTVTILLGVGLLILLVGVLGSLVLLTRSLHKHEQQQMVKLVRSHKGNVAAKEADVEDGVFS